MRSLYFMPVVERFYIRHQFNQLESRLVISSQFLFFCSKSFTSLKPHLAKYEDGNGNSSFLAKMVDFCVRLLCHHSFYIEYSFNRLIISHFREFALVLHLDI